MREIRFKAMLKGMNFLTAPFDWYDLKMMPEAEFIVQNTGVKDVNGKEIYEGDIIKYISREDNINRFVCSDKSLLKANVIYEDCMFTTTGRFNFMVYANECLIIGNIYENPELLNKRD